MATVDRDRAQVVSRRLLVVSAGDGWGAAAALVLGGGLSMLSVGVGLLLVAPWRENERVAANDSAVLLTASKGKLPSSAVF